jgi:mannitol/fructose-specific phosphotransferase system IIA component (Ntr-type)
MSIRSCVNDGYIDVATAKADPFVVESSAIFASIRGLERRFGQLPDSRNTGVPMINSQTVAHLRSAVFMNPVRSKTETETIDELLSALRNQPNVVDPNGLRNAVLQRQKVDPPILPMGVAFPHARTDSVRALVLAVGICPEPVIFGDTPVRLVLLIGVPKAAIAEYLDLTSFLARHLRNQPVLDRLIGATNMSEFLATFAEL